PILQSCRDCPGFLYFKSQLESKMIRLKHEQQCFCEMYYALYKNKLFMWKGQQINESDSNMMNLIYQSPEYRDYVLDENEVGVITNKFENIYSFDPHIKVENCESLSYITNNPPLYKIELYRDIDYHIQKQKEKALEENHNIKFY